MRRLAASLTVLLVAVLGAAPAAAQTFTVAAEAAAAPALRLRLDGARDDVDLGLTAVVAQRPGFGVTWRSDRAFGALGTLVLEGGGDLRVGERRAWAQADAGARGTVGPVAARLRLSAWNAPRTRFDPLADPAPRRAARGGALTLALDGRPARGWIVGGEGRLARDGAQAAWAARLDGFVRALRALPGGHHLRGTVRWVRPVGGGTEAALGVGATWTRRRAPDWRAGVALGMGPDGPGVGLEVEGVERVGADLRLELTARAATFSRGPQPYRLRAALAGPGAGGDWRLDAALGVEATGATSLATRASWRRPW